MDICWPKVSIFLTSHSFLNSWSAALTACWCYTTGAPSSRSCSCSTSSISGSEVPNSSKRNLYSSGWLHPYGSSNELLFHCGSGKESTPWQSDLIYRVWFSIARFYDPHLHFRIPNFFQQNCHRMSSTVRDMDLRSPTKSCLLEMHKDFKWLLLIFLWRFPPFFVIHIRLHDNLGTKQPVTEIHSETPVLQVLKHCSHITTEVLDFCILQD